MNWDNLFEECCPLCGSKFTIENGDRICTAHPIQPFRIKAARYEKIIADLQAEKARTVRVGMRRIDP